MDYLPLGGRWRDFTPRASVSSSITHRVLSLCLHLSSLNLYLLFSAVDVILIDLDCLPILFIAYISYSAHILFDYKLVLVFLYLEV